MVGKARRAVERRGQSNTLRGVSAAGISAAARPQP